MLDFKQPYDSGSSLKSPHSWFTQHGEMITFRIALELLNTGMLKTKITCNWGNPDSTAGIFSSTAKMASISWTSAQLNLLPTRKSWPCCFKTCRIQENASCRWDWDTWCLAAKPHSTAVELNSNYIRNVRVEFSAGSCEPKSLHYCWEKNLNSCSTQTINFGHSVMMNDDTHWEQWQNHALK